MMSVKCFFVQPFHPLFGTFGKDHGNKEQKLYTMHDRNKIRVNGNVTYWWYFFFGLTL